MSTPLAAMVLLGALCWVLRIFAIVLLPAERLPERARQGLGLLAPAVLAALVAVEVDSVTRGGNALTVGLVLATVVAIGVAARLTGNLALGVGIGLGAALFLDLVVG